MTRSSNVELTGVERLAVAWFRRKHRRVGLQSPLPGYDGLLDEMIDMNDRSQAELNVQVGQVLTAFMTRPVERLMAAAARRRPGAMRRVIMQSMPAGFRWLVGPIKATGDSDMLIEDCRVLAGAGPRVCVRVCQKPTEKYFTENLGIPLTLHPDFQSRRCGIHFPTAVDG